MRYLFILWLLLPLTARAASQATIHGRVLDDATGAPLPGVKVTLIDHLGLGAVTLGGREVDVSATDDNGSFEFTGSVSDFCSVSFDMPGFLPEYVDEALPGKDIVVRLQRPGVISGSGLSSSGEPLRNALVELMTKNYVSGGLVLSPVSRGYATTDENGVYRLAGLEPGRYFVRASCRGYDSKLYPNASDVAGALVLNVQAGEAVNEINFQLPSGRRFTVEGQLMDAETGRPATAAFLRAQPADLVLGSFVGGTIHDGHFRVEGMTPGRYFLNFIWVGATNNVKRTVIFPLEVGSTDQMGITLTALPPVTVAGRVVVNRGAVPDHLQVGLESTEPALRARVGSSNFAGDVARDGTFTITGVEAGTYRVRVYSGVQAQFYLHDMGPIVVAGGPISGLEVDLDLSAGSVTGRALDRTGSPLTNALVVLQSADPRKLANDRYEQWRSIGPGGLYLITGIIPGEYLLYAWQGNPGMIGDPDLFDEAVKSAQHIAIRPGRVVQRDITGILQMP